MQEEAQHPTAAQAAVAEAVGPLKVQLTALGERHEASVRVMDRVQDALAGVVAKAGKIVARVDALEEMAQQHPGLWQAAVEEAAGPLRTQLAALGGQQEGTATAVGEVREALAGFAAKSASADTAIAALQVWRGHAWVMALSVPCVSYMLLRQQGASPACVQKFLQHSNKNLSMALFRKGRVN